MHLVQQTNLPISSIRLNIIANINYAYLSNISLCSYNLQLLKKILYTIADNNLIVECFPIICYLIFFFFSFLAVHLILTQKRIFV